MNWSWPRRPDNRRMRLGTRCSPATILILELNCPSARLHTHTHTASGTKPIRAFFMNLIAPFYLPTRCVCMAHSRSSMRAFACNARPQAGHTLLHAVQAHRAKLWPSQISLQIPCIQSDLCVCSLQAGRGACQKDSEKKEKSREKPATCSRTTVPSEGPAKATKRTLR